MEIDVQNESWGGKASYGEKFKEPQNNGELRSFFQLAKPILQIGKEKSDSMSVSVRKMDDNRTTVVMKLTHWGVKYPGRRGGQH